jgi:hypothetical protein
MLAYPGPPDDKGVVQPAGSGDLGVRRPEDFTEHARLPKIEWRPLDRGHLPRGYAVRPRGEVTLGGDLEGMLVDRRGILAVEVEVGGDPSLARPTGPGALGSHARARRAGRSAGDP